MIDIRAICILAHQNKEVPEYPPDAYAPDGTLWWLLTYWPGKRMRFGAEVKVAAWLRFNAQIGDILTMARLRAVIPEDDGRPNLQEHFNRRFRALRPYKWSVPSHRDDNTLAPGQYRFDKEGHPIWLGKAQFRQASISAPVRRQVLARDGNRCVICGVGSGEEYPGKPGSHAVITVGHFRAGILTGPPDLDNLRAECSLCNEPMRDEASNAETVEDVWPRIRALGGPDKRNLLRWLELGQRTRTRLDRIYDDIRVLPPGQRDQLRQRLEENLSGPS
jgi:hypothetical protein